MARPLTLLLAAWAVAVPLVATSASAAEVNGGGIDADADMAASLGAGIGPRVPCVKALHPGVDTGVGQECEAYVCVAVVANSEAVFPSCQLDVASQNGGLVIQPLLAVLVAPADFVIVADVVRGSDHAQLACPPWPMNGLNPASGVGLPPCYVGGEGPWSVSIRIESPPSAPVNGVLSVFAGPPVLP